MTLFPDGIEARLRDAIDSAFSEHDSLAFQPDDATTHIADIIVKHVLPLIGDRLIESEIAAAKAKLAVLDRPMLRSFITVPQCVATSANRDVGFDQWWSVYPRKVGKGAAQKSYEKAISHIRATRTDDPHAWLLDVTREFAASDKGRSGEFCPHPATWLNQHRYDDDTSTWYDNRAADPNGNGAAAMAYLQKRSGT